MAVLAFSYVTAKFTPLLVTGNDSKFQIVVLKFQKCRIVLGDLMTFGIEYRHYASELLKITL